MMVFISKEKLHVSTYSGHLQVLTTFLLSYNMSKPRGDVEISSSSSKNHPPPQLRTKLAITVPS